jgi:hypothetical protein
VPARTGSRRMPFAVRRPFHNRSQKILGRSLSRHQSLNGTRQQPAAAPPNAPGFNKSGARGFSCMSPMLHLSSRSFGHGRLAPTQFVNPLLTSYPSSGLPTFIALLFGSTPRWRGIRWAHGARIKRGRLLRVKVSQSFHLVMDRLKSVPAPQYPDSSRDSDGAGALICQKR